MNEKLAEMKKIQLWILMCELGIIAGDCSAYGMRGWTKAEMIDAIEERLRKEF